MNGYVDATGRALISIHVKSTASPDPIQLEAWIDTGFTGDLVLPKTFIRLLHLAPSGYVDAELANGTVVELETYSLTIAWFDRDVSSEVVSTEAEVPLLSVGLLKDRQLIIDYRGKLVSIS